MSIIEQLLQPISLPRMVRVRQDFPSQGVADVVAALKTEMAKENIACLLRPGMRVAVGVGSRGLAELVPITRTVVAELKSRGVEPFVVPAMGSHGGATAEGQRDLLAGLGVTEASVGCPIVSSMEVVEVGRLDEGLIVWMDKAAYEADGIVVINRVKAHTDFVAPHESGLVKMITVGLGNQKGADSFHSLGFGELGRLVLAMAKVKLAKTRILFGVATTENAYHGVAKVVAVPAEDIIALDRTLLAESKHLLARILLDPLDALIVDQMGKEFSGAGMDPYVTGRAPTPYVSGVGANARIVAVLDASALSHGNCMGMGMADITTRRLFDKIDFDQTYANSLTTRGILSIRIPMTMPNDELAMKASMQMSGATDFRTVRMVRIPNTAEIGEIEISEGLLEEAARHPDITILGDPALPTFDEGGNLTDLGWRRS